MRTFADWSDPSPGLVEIDPVAHSGEDPSSSYLNTLSLTDVASGWTECMPLFIRSGSLVTEALSKVRTAMPFPLRGIDSDNGSEFMNETYLPRTSLPILRHSLVPLAPFAQNSAIGSHQTVPYPPVSAYTMSPTKRRNESFSTNCR